jgi:Flp pilus assembly protein TadG
MTARAGPRVRDTKRLARTGSGWARVARDERGAEAVEMALALPVLLLFLLGTLDVGRMAWTQGTLDFAADAAARCAAIDVTNCATTAQIQAYGAAHAYGMTVAASAFTVTTATCGHNVTVTLPFSLIYGYLTTNSFTLNSSACYPTNPA